MFEKFKNIMNGKSEEGPQTEREAYNEAQKEVEDAEKQKSEKKEVGEKEIKSETVVTEEGGILKVDTINKYVPSEDQERYDKAVDKLRDMLNKNQEEAEELNNKYKQLIDERNEIIKELSEREDEDTKDYLRGQLGQKNKEIREFEKEELNL